VSNWKGTSVLSAVSCFVSCYKREREAEDRRKAGDYRTSSAVRILILEPPVLAFCSGTPVSRLSRPMGSCMSLRS
jgi:hypothetical protein